MQTYSIREEEQNVESGKWISKNRHCFIKLVLSMDGCLLLF